MLPRREWTTTVTLPSRVVLFLSVVLVYALPSPCSANRILLKGGGGTGGYSSSSGGSSSSYGGGSSYYQQPYYGSTYGGSGYYGRPGAGFYGTSSSYGSSSRGGSSSLFWWLIAPLGLLLLFCFCCKKRRRLGHGAPMHGGVPMAGHGMTGYPTGPRPPRSGGKAYSAMRKSDASFLRGSTPGPYLGTPNPVPPSVNGRLFQLGDLGRPTRWIGSYTENGVTRHTRYELLFQQQGGYSAHEGRISGSGADDDGGFTLEGDYNLKTARFAWREVYPSGMKAAVQQQGSTRDGTFITAMAGTFCADTGLSGGLSLAPDTDHAFPAPSPTNVLNPQAVLGGNNHHQYGYPPAAPTAASGPPPGYPITDSYATPQYAPSAPTYPPAPSGTGSYFAYPPAYGAPSPNQAAPWTRGITAEPADPEPKPAPQV